MQIDDVNNGKDFEFLAPTPCELVTEGNFNDECLPNDLQTNDAEESMDLSPSAQRKTRVFITEGIFNQVVHLQNTMSKKDLLDVTGVGKSALNKLLAKLDSLPEGEIPCYTKFYNKPGRKPTSKSARYDELHMIVGADNSLNLQGCSEKLSTNLSRSQICRDMKIAGITRKRLKSRASVTQTLANIEARRLFCARITRERGQHVFFLDESGFNLHTSTNYGYSPKNRNAYIYQPASRGRNVSMCALMSINEVEKYELRDGAYNSEAFLEFLISANRENILTANSVLVLDNVRFHHCLEIKSFFNRTNIKPIFLSPYSPDLNPIEMVFSMIKQRLDKIRPRATTIAGLKNNIDSVMSRLGELSPFYRDFWQKVNEILNSLT